MGFTYDVMLDAILVTNAFKCVNCVSMGLGWFRADLVANPLFIAPFAFWPLLERGDFPTFPIWD